MGKIDYVVPGPFTTLGEAAGFVVATDPLDICAGVRPLGDGVLGWWVRVDTEIFGQSRGVDPRDLRPGEFLTGGEAWSAYRPGEVDASKFGVPGTENWGASEIRGNAVRDLAALNNVETLPWDEWGRMAEAYEGRTGPDYDELLDELAVVCAGGDLDAVAALYRHPDLRVPDELVR